MLSKHQFGFRNEMSTEDAVIKLVNEIVCNLDGKSKCLGVFLDLSKAFDSVSILLDKMEWYGIRGLPLKLVESYLSNRKQRVKINDLISDSADIDYGVPQGSVLAPTLFLLYINDLCQLPIPNCKLYCYADDTALIFNNSSWDNVKLNAESALTQVKTHGLITIFYR